MTASVWTFSNVITEPDCLSSIQSCQPFFQPSSWRSHCSLSPTVGFSWVTLVLLVTNLKMSIPPLFFSTFYMGLSIISLLILYLKNDLSLICLRLSRLCTEKKSKTSWRSSLHSTSHHSAVKNLKSVVHKHINQLVSPYRCRYRCLTFRGNEMSLVSPGRASEAVEKSQKKRRRAMSWSCPRKQGCCHNPAMERLKEDDNNTHMF